MDVAVFFRAFVGLMTLTVFILLLIAAIRTISAMKFLNKALNLHIKSLQAALGKKLKEREKSD